MAFFHFSRIHIWPSRFLYRSGPTFGGASWSCRKPLRPTRSRRRTCGVAAPKDAICVP